MTFGLIGIFAHPDDDAATIPGGVASITSSWCRRDWARPAGGCILVRTKEAAVATVAERFWAEVLDIRRPVEGPGRTHLARRKAVLVRTARGARVRTRR